MTRTKRLLTAATLFGSISMGIGGCSMFRYDSEDVPPPLTPAQPTTVPSNEKADTSTVRGATREVLVDFPTRVYEYLSGKTPASEAAGMEDAKTPDARRDGINRLAGRTFGKEAPYTTRYQQIAQFDTNPLVRATAVRALNRSRDGEATRIFIAGLSDDSPAVRLESAKALVNVPDAGAVQPLLKVFSNAGEQIDTRIAAADALRHYRDPEVAKALVTVLSDREFSLAWQARQSLRAITGQDKRYDQTAWSQFLNGPEKPLG